MKKKQKRFYSKDKRGQKWTEPEVGRPIDFADKYIEPRTQAGQVELDRERRKKGAAFQKTTPGQVVRRVLLVLLGLVLRVYRRSALTTMTILIGSIGVFVFGMEFFVDRWLHQLWSPSWSLVVLTICIGMVIPLIIIRRVPALREEARRRFHL